ncbi:Perchlorate reductase subunit gamma precursor [Symmachiella macrocystis]|uniref:Perchlorate reductase subunit gamma n=1 Tax=Symmachiella macrocystis TaxID=2527985 RepID=A0A5C6BR72_9PLAN|nr:multiheme c-type cytochrome [Symmachiella macrocystis]TWU14222.1 Perchlorate reductase subunit gamma precursor [Symmachiella macrocystis]
MTWKRWQTMPLLIVASAVCAACLSSCGSDDDPSQGDTTSTTPKKDDKPNYPPPAPIFEGWEKPEFVLCVTGETHGYLEPCGCSETQSGGLSRRADLFRQIDDKGWSRAELDLGGSLKRTRRQSQIKFEVLLDAMQQMGYAAMGLGTEELRLDAGYLLSLDTEDQLPLLGANVVLFGSEELTMPKRHFTTEVAGKTIGVISIVGDAYRNEIVPPANDGAMPDVDIINAHDAVTKQLAALTDEDNAAQPDLLVLLSHAPLEESRALAEAFPQFDVVVSAGGYEDPDNKAEQIGESKTMFITVGHKGKHIGVIGYYPEAEQKLKFELIELDNQRFHETPAMTDVMRRYQERLHDEQIVQNMKPVAHESGARFVGVDQCKDCHTKAFSKWSTTRHSHAYDSLSKGREGQEEGWISRVHDPECLACHVTGWNPQQVFPYERGFVDAGSTPQLKGQQCENCHGPGSIHADLENQRVAGNLPPQDEELIRWRKNMHLDQGIAEKQLCNQCHDLDNSPKFDFAEYWKKVAHPGRD